MEGKVTMGIFDCNHGRCLCSRCQTKTIHFEEPLPRVYVADTFRAKTAWGIEQNIRRAECLGLEIAQLGAVPVIPHSMYRYFHGTLPDDFWLDACMQLLRPCHVIITVEGWQSSAGTLNELDTAINKLHIPVFHQHTNKRIVSAIGQCVFATWLADWKASR